MQGCIQAQDRLDVSLRGQVLQGLLWCGSPFCEGEAGQHSIRVQPVPAMFHCVSSWDDPAEAGSFCFIECLLSMQTFAEVEIVLHLLRAVQEMRARVV